MMLVMMTMMILIMICGRQEVTCRLGKRGLKRYSNKDDAGDDDDDDSDNDMWKARGHLSSG